MTVNIPVPSLSPQGWITDPSSKADSLLSYFYETMHSQSYLYNGEVSSMQYLLQKHNGNINSFTEDLQNTLETYLSRYYDLAIVTTSNDDRYDDNNSSVEVTIHCLVTEGGVTHSIGNLLRITNAKVTAVSKLVNG